MRKILLIMACSRLFFQLAHAGNSYQIPVELLRIENLGRTKFLLNALEASSLMNQEGVFYEHLRTVVIGGDERDSDYSGGYFVFSARLRSPDNAIYDCHQFLTAGSFDQHHPELSRPIVCINN